MVDRIKLGLGGGCHWCTEAVFKAIPGVSNVLQGYIKSMPPDHSYSEAILLDYDPDKVTLEKLLQIHLATHSSTVDHSRRDAYRSAIYTFNKAQLDATRLVVSTLSRKHKKNYILQALPMISFKESRESIRDYYATRPEAPFCKRYIEPKLDIVKKIQNQ